MGFWQILEIKKNYSSESSLKVFQVFKVNVNDLFVFLRLSSYMDSSCCEKLFVFQHDHHHHHDNRGDVDDNDDDDDDQDGVQETLQ